MLRLAILLAGALALTGCNKPTTQTTAPQGTLTATLTEPTTVTKTVACVTVTKSGTGYLCTPEATPPDCTANPTAPGCTPPACTTDCPPPASGDICTSNDTKTPNEWGNATVETSAYGDFVHQTLAVRIVVPTTASGGSVRTSGWVEYGTGKFQRDGAFSTVACSFAPADALTNGYGGKVTTKGNVAPSFLYRIGSAQGGAVGLTPGQTYWINLRNRDSDGAQNCTVPSCTMRGNVPN